MILIYGIMNEIKFRGTQNTYMWLILKQGLESIAITILNGLWFTGESKGTKSFPTTWSANNQKIQLLMFNRLPYLFLSKKPSSIRKRAWGGDVIQPFGQTVYRLSKLSMQKARRDSLEVQKPSANKANEQRLNHHRIEDQECTKIVDRYRSNLLDWYWSIDVWQNLPPTLNTHKS